MENVSCEITPKPLDNKRPRQHNVSKTSNVFFHTGRISLTIVLYGTESSLAGDHASTKLQASFGLNARESIPEWLGFSCLVICLRLRHYFNIRIYPNDSL